MGRVPTGCGAGLAQVGRGAQIPRRAQGGDAVLIFKTLVLSALYNLSGDQTRYRIRDRRSFMRFLGLGLGDRVPDAKAVWLYLEALAQAGMVEEVFGLFDGYLARQGSGARGAGSYWRSSGHAPPPQARPRGIVPVLCPHNKRAENAAVKAGGVPGDWENRPAKRSRKDVDAGWSEADQKTVRGNVFPTNKHGTSPYGTRNHSNVDRKHQLIRRYHVSDAATQDSQAVDALLTRGNTGSWVRAGAAWLWPGSRRCSKPES